MASIPALAEQGPVNQLVDLRVVQQAAVLGAQQLAVQPPCAHHHAAGNVDAAGPGDRKSRPMTRRIRIDPVTRLEGHGRIDIRLDEAGNVIGQTALRIGQRVRDVRQGPDGLLYVLTDESNGSLIRLEPTSEKEFPSSP